MAEEHRSVTEVEPVRVAEGSSAFNLRYPYPLYPRLCSVYALQLTRNNSWSKPGENDPDFLTYSWVLLLLQGVLCEVVGMQEVKEDVAGIG